MKLVLLFASWKGLGSPAKRRAPVSELTAQWQTATRARGQHERSQAELKYPCWSTVPWGHCYVLPETKRRAHFQSQRLLCPIKENSRLQLEKKKKTHTRKRDAVPVSQFESKRQPKKRRARSQEKAVSTLWGSWLWLPRSGEWECVPIGTIPHLRPEPPDKYWHSSGWITASCPAEVSLPPTVQPSPPCTARNIRWELAPRDARDKSASVCVGLTCLFALQAGKCGLQAVIQEEWQQEWLIDNGMRDGRAPRAVPPPSACASHPKFFDCWYKVLCHAQFIARGKPGFMKSVHSHTLQH